MVLGASERCSSCGYAKSSHDNKESQIRLGYTKHSKVCDNFVAINYFMPRYTEMVV